MAFYPSSPDSQEELSGDSKAKCGHSPGEMPRGEGRIQPFLQRHVVGAGVAQGTSAVQVGKRSSADVFDLPVSRSRLLAGVTTACCAWTPASFGVGRGGGGLVRGKGGETWIFSSFSLLGVF